MLPLTLLEYSSPLVAAQALTSTLKVKLYTSNAEKPQGSLGSLCACCWKHFAVATMAALFSACLGALEISGRPTSITHFHLQLHNVLWKLPEAGSQLLLPFH